MKTTILLVFAAGAILGQVTEQQNLGLQILLRKHTDATSRMTAAQAERAKLEEAIKATVEAMKQVCPSKEVNGDADGIMKCAEPKPEKPVEKKVEKKEVK